MRSNDELVDYLVSTRRITSHEVEKAFRNVDRALFVPKKFKGRAYEDAPVPIGENSFLSAPHIVATNTELLEVGKDHRVLELGSGSGYQLAILAELAREAIGVEIVGDLVESSKNVLEKYQNIDVLHGRGFQPFGGNFDRVLFSYPIKDFDDAKEYLREDGIIVGPVKKSEFQILSRFKEGQLSKHGAVNFA